LLKKNQREVTDGCVFFDIRYNPKKVITPFNINNSIPILKPLKTDNDIVFKESATDFSIDNLLMNHSELFNISTPNTSKGAAMHIQRLALSLICRLVRIPNANKPSKGP
jgi:hypothetical protein